MVTPIAFACEAGRLATFTGSATFEDKTEDSSRSQKRPDLHDLLVEECGFAECGRRLMGRAGFEPATLGLKSGQKGRNELWATETGCNERRPPLQGAELNCR
jgi:hypothetical protein